MRTRTWVPVVAGLLLLPPLVLAQEPVKGERVEVTGSSIKRIDGETALPVTILRREDIDRLAPSTTEELMKSITASTSAGAVTVSQANGTITTSQANVSLRALGATRTLVLVNGRRVAIFGGTTATAVDVNSIPLSAIERVEVLKEGASSLYGSDAIAGVVNFILKRDYAGAEATIGGGSPTRTGGGKEVRGSAYMGFGNLDRDRYNVNFGVGYEKIDPILGKDRGFARNINVDMNNDLSSTIAFPANVLYGATFSSLASPAFPNCGPTGIVSPFFSASATSGRACRFENSPFLSVQSGLKKENVLLNLHFALSGTTELYAEGAWTRTENSYITQPVPLSEATQLPAGNPYIGYLQNLVATQYSTTLPTPLRRFVTGGNTLLLLGPSSPYYPSAAFLQSVGLTPGAPIAFRYRDFANGERHTRDDGDNYRALVGVKGTVAGWDFDSALRYSESKASSNLLAGYPQYSRFLPILDSGVINPFGESTPAAVAAAQGAEFRDAIYKSRTSDSGIDAKLSRDLFSLRGGTAGVAVGAEAREETFKFDPSTAFQLGDIAGFGGNTLPVDVRRHVYSAYGEVSLPFFKFVEADLGVRFDDYQTVGSTTNPKISIRVQPIESVLIRGSYGTGFRAPSLTDLYSPQASSVTPNGTRDPIRCPNPATGNPSDCNNQFATVTGGNPNLKPEKSRSATLGILFEPVRNVSIGVDMFWIFLKDSIVIGGLGSNFLLANANNATQYAQYILRGAPDGNASGVGPIIGVVSTTSNLFKQRVDGYDVDFKARLYADGADRVTARLDGTYFWDYDTQNADGSYTVSMDRAIRAGGGVVPRWKHVASLTWEHGAWTASAVQNFQAGYQDQLSTFNPAPRDVGAYETYDIQGAWTGLRNLRVVLGMKNVMDKDPPYTNAGGQFAAGYDISYADVRGRFIYGVLQYRFR